MLSARFLPPTFPPSRPCSRKYFRASSDNFGFFGIANSLTPLRRFCKFALAFLEGVKHNTYMEREYSYEEIADARTNLPYVYTERCDQCGKEQEQLFSLPGDTSNYCPDCFAENSMILEAESICDVLHELVCTASNVAQVAELMAEHACEACRVPGRKPVQSVRADATGKSQQEVA